MKKNTFWMIIMGVLVILVDSANLLVLTSLHPVKYYFTAAGFKTVMTLIFVEFLPAIAVALPVIRQMEK